MSTRRRPLALQTGVGAWGCTCPDCDAWMTEYLRRLYAEGLRAEIEDDEPPPASWLAI